MSSILKIVFVAFATFQPISANWILLSACKNGNYDAVREIVYSEGYYYDINYVESTTGRNAVHWAAASGKNELVKMLMEANGINDEVLNYKDYDAHTPLMIAFQENEYEIMKTLVRAGAKINLQKGNGETIVHDVVECGNCEMLRFLVVEQGGSANIEDNNGITPLIKAAEMDSFEKVKILLMGGGKFGDLDDGMAYAVQNDEAFFNEYTEKFPEWNADIDP